MLTEVIEGCDVENTLESSLRKAILYSESICSVSEYVLSWQSMEKSMHYQRTERESNPLSEYDSKFQRRQGRIREALYNA